MQLFFAGSLSFFNNLIVLTYTTVKLTQKENAVCVALGYLAVRPWGYFSFASRMQILLIARSQASLLSFSFALASLLFTPYHFITHPSLLRAVWSLPSPSLPSLFSPLDFSPSLLFPRFHLAATRGHLDCLNLILGHSVDVTATDATGEFKLDGKSTLELYYQWG